MSGAFSLLSPVAAVKDKPEQGEEPRLQMANSTTAAQNLMATAISVRPGPAKKFPGSPGVRRMDATQKEIASRLVSSAENSSLDWRAQYAYIEDIGDGRGFTAGVIGFCTGTGDLLNVVRRYTQSIPDNALARFLPALERVDGTASHRGVRGLPRAWRAAASDPLFQRAQDEERDAVYFDPAVAQAQRDGLRALGQFCYYDAMVMHGPGDDRESFGGIREAALRLARPPARGGDEAAYLRAFLGVRRQAMLAEEAHANTSRIDTAQAVFLRNDNLDLQLPLHWQVYGDDYEINSV
jgi:chitosanase